MLRKILLGAAVACLFASMPIIPFALADEPQADAKDEKKVEPIDFRKLKEFLPESVAEIPRTEARGSKNSVGEAKISQAEGEYSKDGSESTASVSIMDYGAVPWMVAGMAAWENMEIDNESDDEYQRTVTYGKYRGYETYNTKEKSGQLQLLVAKRFLISIDLNKIEPEYFGKTVESMKLDDLAALAEK